MLVLFVALLIILAAAGLVVAYVASPRRGAPIPRTSGLTRQLRQLVDRIGLDPDADEAAQGGALTELREQRRADAAARDRAR